MPSLYVVDTRIEATIQKQVNRDMLKLVKLARGSGVEAEPR
jgi:hypothetical protein